MLIQLLLDAFSEIFAGFMALIPPMPPEVALAMAEIGEGMGFLQDLTWSLGIIVPFDAVAAVINLWGVGIGIWLVCISIAMVLRILRTGS
ncbi:MAG TPA: hypothetical protein VK595_00620 [Vicinamibacterales bacterium]|nr:hypothetical protein [Vicinamibacterales bacterium]